MRHSALTPLLVTLCLASCSKPNSTEATIRITLASPITLEAATARIEVLMDRYNGCKQWGSPRLREKLKIGAWECRSIETLRETRYNFRLERSFVNFPEEPLSSDYRFNFANHTTFEYEERQLYRELYKVHLPQLFPQAIRIEPAGWLADNTDVRDLVDLSEAEGIPLTPRALENIDCYNIRNAWLLWRKIEAPGSEGQCRKHR